MEKREAMGRALAMAYDVDPDIIPVNYVGNPPLPAWEIEADTKGDVILRILFYLGFELRQLP